MRILSKIPLAPYTTFMLGGVASYFCEIESSEDIEECVQFAEEKNIPLIVLGGGSNVIFPDTPMHALVAHMKISGFEVLREDDDGVFIKVGAGEEWDSVVERVVARGLSGIEALSSIPGTAGATPIQNVGAYGQEIKDVLVSVEVYDIKNKTFKTLDVSECGLTYRDSKFKHEWKNVYIITSLVLKLSHRNPSVPAYPGVLEYFKTQEIESPTLADIRRAIIEIRKVKLPDPKVIASCGSFFKNPFISAADAEKLRTKHPNAVLFPASGGTYKAGAGWMIEKAGLKGKDFGNLSIYPKNALVLINNGHATRAEVEAAAAHITGAVKQEFGITLEPEPIFITT